MVALRHVLTDTGRPLIVQVDFIVILDEVPELFRKGLGSRLVVRLPHLARDVSKKHGQNNLERYILSSVARKVRVMFADTLQKKYLQGVIQEGEVLL